MEREVYCFTKRDTTSIINGKCLGCKTYPLGGVVGDNNSNDKVIIVCGQNSVIQENKNNSDEIVENNNKD